MRGLHSASSVGRGGSCHRAAVAFLDWEQGEYALRVASTSGIDRTLDPVSWSVTEMMTPSRVGLGSAGEPVVAWTEGADADSVRAYVARANR